MGSENTEFMLKVTPETLDRLATKAERRGVTIQQLLRTEVVPAWLRDPLSWAEHTIRVISGFNES